LPDSEDSETKHLCFACVGEAFLSAEIKRSGQPASCSYCGNKRKCITIEEMADRIEGAFEQHYRRTSPDPNDFEYMLMKDPESSYDFERHGEPVVWAIAGAAGIDEAPATDIQQILQERHSDWEMAQMGEECEFDSDSHYEEKDPNDIEMREEWRYFERSLKTETRFFNQHGQATLDAVFEGLADHETRDGRRVVVRAGPGREIASLYRARVFQSSEPLEEALKRPDIGLGPPPFAVATAGRMNARGISVFYGALDPVVALAEIRPPVGSRVMVGKFNLLRPLRLLNVEALKAVFIKGSIFDGTYIRTLERAKFLGRLSSRITQPVMPSDEPSDYLVTQAIADYLASEVRLDGIVYPSAQAGGATENLVLFHRAARVQLMELPPGTDLGAHTYTNTEDGPEMDYWVWEDVPADKQAPDDPPLRALKPEPPASGTTYDQREVTLQLDLESVQVHHIEAVAFTTKAHMVRRHRSKTMSAGVARRLRD
jgi:hypothetical protein